MRKQRGFTLTELLTVISIIAILMAILLPSLSGMRRRAKAAVCMSNLRQWGLVYKMYTDEFDGKLPQNYGEFAWYYPIRNYYSDEQKILLCPMAKKPSDPEGTSARPPYGGTFLAWGLFSTPQEHAVWDRTGSYGLNSWAYKRARIEVSDANNTNTENGGGGSSGAEGSSGSGVLPANNNRFWMAKHRRYSRRTTYDPNRGDSSDEEDVNDSSDIEEPNEVKDSSRYWETAYETKKNNIPMVFDSAWLYSFFDDNASPPWREEDSIRYFGQTNTTCINRHDSGINIGFMDFSARKVGLKELWTLKWHRNFNTAGPWTKAGGAQPEYWPKWMRKYKDY